MTGFKPASEVVYKGCIHCYADRRNMTFLFGENPHFLLGVDTENWAEKELAVAVAEGITDGKRPHDLVTREEAAIMAMRSKG